MFAYVENGKFIRFQLAPSDPESGGDLTHASIPTLRSFGWYPVVVDRVEIGPEQTRSDDIIVVDGDVVRVIQTARNLSDEEVFYKVKNNILAMIEAIEAGQTDRAERELMLTIAEHLNLTDNEAYIKIRAVEDRIREQRKILRSL